MYRRTLLLLVVILGFPPASALLGAPPVVPAEAGLFSALGKAAKLGAKAGKAAKAGAAAGKAGKLALVGGKVSGAALLALSAERSVVFLGSLSDDAARGAGMLARTEDGLHLFTPGAAASTAWSSGLAAEQAGLRTLYVDVSAATDLPRALPAGVERVMLVDGEGVAHALQAGDDGRWLVDVTGDLMDVADLASAAVQAGADTGTLGGAGEGSAPAPLQPGDWLVMGAVAVGMGVLVWLGRGRPPELRAATALEIQEQASRRHASKPRERAFLGVIASLFGVGWLVGWLRDDDRQPWRPPGEAPGEDPEPGEPSGNDCA